MIRVVIVVLWLILLHAPLPGSTIKVPQDMTSIQSAIDSAVSGDTILVSPGTYFEALHIPNGLDITLKGARGPILTVIDGSKISSVVRIEQNHSIVEGFTLMNGKGYKEFAGVIKGGGLYINEASCTIRNNIIRHNRSTIVMGGGIYAKGPSIPIIMNNIIAYNQVTIDGGGIFLDNDCDAVISNNRIISNEAFKSGGGICSNVYSLSTIRDNVINYNICSYRGAGIDVGDDILILNNVIAYNTGAEDGGGIYIGHNDASVINNLIYANAAGNGGGLFSLSAYNAPDSPQIINNTIYANSAAEIGGGVWVLHSEAILKNNVIWSNNATSWPQIRISTTGSVISYCNIQGGAPGGGTGNIDVDPRFIDPGNLDFHMSQHPCQPGVSNPCVNGGKPTSFLITGTTRSDRFQDDGIVDMGYHHPLAETWYVPDQHSNIQGAINAARDGDTIIVAPGTYPQFVVNKGVTIKSMGGPSVTTIDPGQTSRCVLFKGGSAVSPVLDGFTLTNGFMFTEDGGGILCRPYETIFAPPIIKNNIIHDNFAMERGGGIACQNGMNSILINNVIYNNSAKWGGGIHCKDSDPEIINNTIWGNEGHDVGGGIEMDTSSPKIMNCIIRNNEALIGAELNISSSGNPTVSYCNIKGGYAAGDHILDKAAKFEGASNGDFHLKQTSPCINRGTYYGGSAGWDFEGNPRPFMGASDMGAFEYTGTHFLSPAMEYDMEWAVTSVAATSELWPATHAMDGNTASCWSSDFAPSAYHYEYIAYWFEHHHPINYVKVHPRYLNYNEVLGFPVSFHIYYSNGSEWVHTKAFSHFPKPVTGGWVELPLDETVYGNGILIATSILGQDDGGGFVFQIAEVSAGCKGVVPYDEDGPVSIPLDLNAGIENANRKYLILGGVTGTMPGFALPQNLATLPLNWDIFTDLVWQLSNTYYFENFLGTLDAEGKANAAIQNPGALPPGKTGLMMYFAYCLNSPFDFVSNPIQVEVIP